MIDTIAMELFEAYAQNKLPEDKGFILSAFFQDESAYSIYELISYSEIKEVYMTSDALSLKAKTKKIILVVEPAKFQEREIEPNMRSKAFNVPLSFSNSYINISTSKAKMIFNKEPEEMTEGFEILKPEGLNFSFLFYCNDKNIDAIKNIENFLIKSINQEAIIPLPDAKKTAKQFLGILDK